jgi:hypothetical protein
MESQIYDAIIKQATTNTQITDLLTAYPIWSVVSSSGSTIYVQPNVFNMVLIAEKMSPTPTKKSYNQKSKKNDTSIEEIDEMIKLLKTSVNPITQTMTMSINTG